MLVTLFNVVALSWPVSEVILGLVTRGKRHSAAVRDRGSLLIIWLAIAVGLTAANLIRFRGVGSIDALPTRVLSVGMIVMVAGLILRWTAILTLGRLFTSTVTLRSGQTVVRSGVYRYMRHPSYSGLLVAFLGLGLGFNNWLSLAALLIPILGAILYRIHVEEEALVIMLGHDYTEYRKVTKRLIPGVY